MYLKNGVCCKKFEIKTNESCKYAYMKYNEGRGKFKPLIHTVYDDVLMKWVIKFVVGLGDIFTLESSCFSIVKVYNSKRIQNTQKHTCWH